MDDIDREHPAPIGADIDSRRIRWVDGEGSSVGVRKALVEQLPATTAIRAPEDTPH